MPGKFPQETLSINLNDAHSYFLSILRSVRGLIALSEPDNPPEEPLELYEFEGCPYCRKVREVLTELDLEYVCRPCGKGSNNRDKIRKLGGKEQFPFLVDPNTNRSMYESEDIIDYVCDEYGTGRYPFGRLSSPINTLLAGVTSAVRPKGIFVPEQYRNREQPEKSLELYNFENSPFCRKVREKLCTLNLDYLVHNVGKGSSRRKELEERGGKIQVPFLIDPNTGTELYESYDIVDYLEATYG